MCIPNCGHEVEHPISLLLLLLLLLILMLLMLMLMLLLLLWLLFSHAQNCATETRPGNRKPPLAQKEGILSPPGLSWQIFTKLSMEMVIQEGAEAQHCAVPMPQLHQN